MTKTDLLRVLHDLLQTAEELADQVDDIMSTPIEEIEELVKGKIATYGHPGVKGLEDNANELVDAIDELIGDVDGEELNNE